MSLFFGCLGLNYLLLLAAFFILCQSASHFLAGFDGYFHIKYSHILAHEKFIDRLPWLQYTIHNNSFLDHHLLWHYLLIPFSLGDLIVGGQVATLVSFLVVSLVLYFVLHESGVKHSALWEFLPFCRPIHFCTVCLSSGCRVYLLLCCY